MSPNHIFWPGFCPDHGLFLYTYHWSGLFPVHNLFLSTSYWSSLSPNHGLLPSSSCRPGLAIDHGLFLTTSCRPSLFPDNSPACSTVSWLVWHVPNQALQGSFIKPSDTDQPTTGPVCLLSTACSCLPVTVLAYLQPWLVPVHQLISWFALDHCSLVLLSSSCWLGLTTDHDLLLSSSC